MTMPDILLVGCGKMGSALLRRWKELGIAKNISVVEPAQGMSAPPDSFKPDIVVFAVKPQVLPEIAGTYKKYEGVLFLSIAAGKPVSFFEKHLGAGAKIVRAMPNTPAAIGQGITVACANKNVSSAEKKQAESLLAAVGEVLWVEDENLLNPVTALSGSGPAYVFLLIEVLAKAGVRIGLEKFMAEKLARQTVIGAAALAAHDAALSAAVLRENVTSPGGTTEAALKILMANPGIQGLFDEALAEASRRAAELSG